MVAVFSKPMRYCHMQTEFSQLASKQAQVYSTVCMTGVDVLALSVQKDRHNYVRAV